MVGEIAQATAHKQPRQLRCGRLACMATELAPPQLNRVVVLVKKYPVVAGIMFFAGAIVGGLVVWFF